MPIIVQKFGGTSVANIPQIERIAELIIKTQNTGKQVVAVVSAMAGDTDRLESLAYQITDVPDGREFDVLLAAGEQISMSLLCMALLSRGCKAQSYTGMQVPIKTDSVHGRAKIEQIDVAKIKADLAQNGVVVVAGFQGVDCAGNITTLGRGGSDTTAAALAAALRAEECQIFTDVDGIYNADPNIVYNAHKIAALGVHEMQEFASNGAQVLHHSAAALAAHYNIPLRVLSALHPESQGTVIDDSSCHLCERLVTGVVTHNKQALVSVIDIKTHHDLDQILYALSQQQIPLDIVSHTNSKNYIHLTFSCENKFLDQILAILKQLLGAQWLNQVSHSDKLAKLSLVGIGLRSDSGIISQISRVLSQHGVFVVLIICTEIKVSVLVDENLVERGANVLHKAFGLEATNMTMNKTEVMET